LAVSQSLAGAGGGGFMAVVLAGETAGERAAFDEELAELGRKDADFAFSSHKICVDFEGIRVLSEGRRRGLLELESTAKV